MEEKVCQSCGMPFGESTDMFGTNTDGSINEDYCKYCYENGAFTMDVTMEEMIDFCVPHIVEADPEMTEEKARAIMSACLPQLKRWNQQ